MTEKLIIDMPVIVEGKYDQIKLDSVIQARIIPTRGFGVFTSPDMRDFLIKLSKKTKIIVLTDSDGAGRVIRNHLKSFLPPESMINLYIPDIEGKEKRKKSPSKAGTLGVEGMKPQLLRELFAPYQRGAEQSTDRGGITKAHLYEDGLLGSVDSKAKRYEVAKKLSLPKELSSNAFLDALNMMCSYDEYKELLK
ncbi:MAG: DUF4093 domain-containing protein [Clostridia bacterium]|nr:DUF4093 domain-containing protein [Clostridia bacterium]